MNTNNSMFGNIGTGIGAGNSSTSGIFNFSNGFKYQNQDVSTYEEPMTTADIKQREVESNLKVKVPNIKTTAEEKEAYYDSLSEDDQILFENRYNEGYGFQSIKTLMEHKDKFKDPYAEGTGKYELAPSRVPQYTLGGLGTIGGIGLGLEGLGAINEYGGVGLSKIGRGIYGLTLNPSMDEARAIQKLTANKNIAKNNLAKAKSVGEGVKEAEQALENSMNNLKKFRGIADTAYDYSLGGGITKNWRPTSRGADARAKAYTIFNDTIEPALKQSQTKINVKNLVNEIEGELDGLIKLDPDKAVEYKQAFKELKKAFSDGKYSSLSLADTQTLKSGLQGRTPQKFFKQSKFSSEREITSAYQELRGILSNKLKDSVQNSLNEELGENAAKLYKDYANLIEYADKQAYKATKGGFRGGVGKFITSGIEAVGEPLTEKGGLALGKFGEWMEKTFKKVRPSTRFKSAKDSLSSLKDVLNQDPKSIYNAIKTAISKNPKALKGFIDPASLIMPDGNDLIEDVGKKFTLDLINARMKGEAPFKGKTEEEIEKILPMESIISTFADNEFRDWLESKGIDISEYDDLTK